MAVILKYRATLTDIDGDTIKLEIFENDFTGTVEEITLTANEPIIITHESDPTNKETHIIPSRVEVSIVTNALWDMNELLYATDRQHKVLVRKGSRRIFEGWLMAGVQSENHMLGTYTISITATDGLADLKTIPYLDNGELYDSYQLPVEIIQNCLEKIEIGNSYLLRENVDIYATSGMTVSPIPDYSPLNQCHIHSRAYGNSIETVSSCWEVLEKVMQAFHCRLFQSEDVDPTSLGFSWIMSKIDRVYIQTTYRLINALHNVIGGDSYTFAPSKSIGGGLERIGNGGQITIKQAYKEVRLKTKRGYNFSLLSGGNFNSSDFDSDISLKNWGSNPPVAGNGWWGVGSFQKEQLGEETVVALEDYVGGGGTLGGDNSVNNGSGKLRIQSVASVLAGDIILIENEDYRVFAKIMSTSGSTFDLDVNHVSDQKVRWLKANDMKYIGYLYPLSLDPDHIPVTDAHHLKVNLKYYIEEHLSGDSWGFAAAIVIAYKSSTDYKVLNKKGQWSYYNANIFPAIIDTWDEVYLDREPFSKETSISITADLSTDNNFYSSGSPKFYIGLCNVNGVALGRKIKWISARVSLVYGEDEEIITPINTDFVESKEIEFFHPDGDGGNNEEFRYMNPIVDDATPKRFINSWKQRTESSKNLEAITQQNIVNNSSLNSQVWSGMLQGDVSILNALVDPFNFNRVFQIQTIMRNIVHKTNQISMIECVPKLSYYVERIDTTGGGAGDAEYHLSSIYGDVRSLFLDGDTVYTSAFRRKSDGELLDEGGVRDLNDVSLFVSGRTILIMNLPAYFTGSTEVKAILTREGII